jgi:2-dehydro-3-deoxyphosphogalactonate aldolase
MIRPYVNRLPLIAILRGITPEEAGPVARVLATAGFAIIEVPLNSPRPLDSIRLLSVALGDICLVGGGTITAPTQVNEIGRAGGRLIVMPHSDPVTVRTAKAAGLACLPGVATPTEGFAALENGADALKLFPAEELGPPVVRAWRAVFPPETLFIPVGGITPENLASYWDAGADGFGLGSALYKPGMRAEDVSARAHTFIDAWHAAVEASPRPRST